MNPWDTVRSTINNHPREDPSWRSQRESLMRILAKAEEWGIDPANALNVQISAWSTIILEAKRAVRWEQPLFLAEIFRLAATLPIVELRLALHVSDIDEINVVQSGDQFMLVLSQPQFERVQRSTRARHVYRVKPATTFANDPGGFRDGLRQLQTRS